jgi:hypothetical protein
MTRAGDDAERSDAEERRATPAGDDDAGAAGIEERRATPADDDASAKRCWSGRELE